MRLFFYPGVEPGGIDHDTLVRAFRNRVDAVVRRKPERQLASFDPVQPDLDRDRQSRRRGGKVREID